MTRLSDERQADMDAWGLTADQRVRHMHRVSDYHAALFDRALLAYGRIQRVELTAGLAMLCWFAVSMLLLWLVG